MSHVKTWHGIFINWSSLLLTLARNE